MEAKNGQTLSWAQTDAGKRVQAQLADERTLIAIERLLGRMETLEKAVENLAGLAAQGPGMMAMLGDMADEAYREADEQGVNLEERLRVAYQMAEKLTHPSMLEKVDQVLQLSDQLPGLVAMTIDSVDEGMQRAVDNGFDPKTLLEVASATNTALTKANAEPPTPVGGIFSLLRALKDPDRQKAMGFLMSFLQHFGRQLS